MIWLLGKIALRGLNDLSSYTKLDGTSLVFPMIYKDTLQSICADNDLIRIKVKYGHLIVKHNLNHDNLDKTVATLVQMMQQCPMVEFAITRMEYSNLVRKFYMNSCKSVDILIDTAICTPDMTQEILDSIPKYNVFTVSCLKHKTLLKVIISNSDDFVVTPMHGDAVTIYTRCSLDQVVDKIVIEYKKMYKSAEVMDWVVANDGATGSMKVGNLTQFNHVVVIDQSPHLLEPIVKIVTEQASFVRCTYTEKKIIVPGSAKMVLESKIVKDGRLLSKLFSCLPLYDKLDILNRFILPNENDLAENCSTYHRDLGCKRTVNVCRCCYGSFWRCCNLALADCYHSGNECRAVPKTTDLEKVWFLLYTKLCPNKECGVIIEREQGCNHMKCGLCKYEFSWRNAEYGSIEYYEKKAITISTELS